MMGEGQQSFQTHALQQHFQQNNSQQQSSNYRQPPAPRLLFEGLGEKLTPGQDADIDVVGFIGALGTVTTPAKFLEMLGSVGKIDLNETAAVLATKQTLAPLYAGLKDALVNIITLKQLQQTLPIIFPSEFTVIKTKPKPPTIEKVNVVRESEGESEIAVWKKIGEESLNALKDMQYTNERKRRREYTEKEKDRKAETGKSLQKQEETGRSC